MFANRFCHKATKKIFKHGKAKDAYVIIGVKKSQDFKSRLRLLRFELRLVEVLHQGEALRIYVKDHRVTARTFSYSRSCMKEFSPALPSWRRYSV